MVTSLSRTLRYARTWRTGQDDVVQRELVLDRDGMAIPATLMRPRISASPLPAWVVMHGITYAGRTHAQLVRFGRAVASTGAAVIIPEVPEWRQLDLAPHLAAPTIRSAIDFLRTSPEVRQAPVGLVGFSFGAPHTVASAGCPMLRADIAGAVAFGGYCDLAHTIRFMMTGRHEHNGRTLSLRPDPYGRWIVAANYLTEAAGYEGAVDVANSLRRLATLAGDIGAPAWSSQYDRAKVQIGERLSPDCRELFNLIAPPSDREPDPEEGCKLASLLAEGGKRAHPQMDPSEALAQVTSPVHVLHGRFDHLIPFSEGLRLREALPSQSESYATVTRLFGHSAQDPLPSPVQAVREVPLLFGALNRIFRMV
jgi:pimeloyl-ACP methyl ester carboxylesterase